MRQPRSQLPIDHLARNSIQGPPRRYLVLPKPPDILRDPGGPARDPRPGGRVRRPAGLTAGSAGRPGAGVTV